MASSSSGGGGGGWFSLDSLSNALTDATHHLAEATQQLTEATAEATQQLQSTIQSSIPPDAAASVAETLSSAAEGVGNVNASALIEKLTLQSPEMAEERQQIAAEELRKEFVKNALAELLPWETRDEERAILTDECRDLVLALTDDADGKTTLEDKPEDVSKLLEEAMSERRLKEEAMSHGATSGATTTTGGRGSFASLQDLKNEQQGTAEATLVPPLLADFDFDAHVGLIGRLMQVDDKLVARHADLSGKAVKEVDFWKAYFLHCALCRVRVGLDVDEIWGGVLPTTEEMKRVMAAGRPTRGADSEGKEVEESSVGEDEITFDQGSCASENAAPASGGSAGLPRSRASSQSSMSAGANAAASLNPTSMHSYVPFGPAADGGQGVAADAHADGLSSKSSSPPSDYELVSGPGVTGAESAAAVSSSQDDDLDLDDLDAEIARELAEAS